MKIVVDELPESAKDCLFADYDHRAVGYGVWHNCKISGITCYVDYGDPCPYLTTKIVNMRYKPVEEALMLDAKVAGRNFNYNPVDSGEMSHEDYENWKIDHGE